MDMGSSLRGGRKITPTQPSPVEGEGFGVESLPLDGGG